MRKTAAVIACAAIVLAGCIPPKTPPYTSTKTTTTTTKPPTTTTRPPTTTTRPPTTTTTTTTTPAPGGTVVFNGDLSTGNFSQWPSVQNKFYNGPGDRFTGNRAATIVNDPAKGPAVRFEVREGDWPGFASGERSDMGASKASGGTEGQMRWYQWSTKFEPGFPSGTQYGWAATNGFHPDSSRGSSTFEFSTGTSAGNWTVDVIEQSAPGSYIRSYPILQIPINPGNWHDIKLQVFWSVDKTKGYLRLWHNGIRQRFLNGQDTVYFSTIVPGTPTSYYKQGYYREGSPQTAVVYMTGFRAATTEAALG